MSGISNCLCLADFENEARKKLPKPIYGYIAATAETGNSYRNNLESFQKYSFVTKVLSSSAENKTDVEIMGFHSQMPFGIAPVGISALFTYRSDSLQAGIARQRQMPMIMSGSSLIPMEEVAKINPDAWFQAYLPREAAKMEALIARVEKANFKTLVVTVDTQVNPNKENFIRAGFSSPLKPSVSLFWQGITHPSWLINTFLKTVASHGIPHFENNYAAQRTPIIAKNIERDFSDRALSWANFKRVRELWPHKLVIKGVLNANDAVAAAELGVDGIILSNHGGRQLDSAIAPLSVLPEVVSRCPSVPVMVDGGIRRGADVIKCYALGAKFVFVGRPFAYAAAAGGRQGIEKVIDLLSSEIQRNLTLLGATDIAEVNSDFLLAKA